MIVSSEIGSDANAPGAQATNTALAAIVAGAPGGYSVSIDGARHFNWAEPTIPRDHLNTKTHYLGNRPRPKGVVEKCTFCIQRVRAGRYPACVEVCPVGARKFGNLLDPKSEIRYVIENKRVLVLKEELNTMPKFFYFYGT